MSVIEMELAGGRFAALAQFLASAAGIPAPIFGVLGSDRLISGLEWGPLTPVAAQAPGVADIPGTVMTRASLAVDHVSVAELATPVASPPTRTQLTAWVRWSLSTGGGMTAAIVRLDAPGTSQVLSPPLTVANRRIPLQAVGDVQQAGIFFRDDVVTLRFCTSPADSVMAPTSNRSADRGAAWSFFLSSGVFVDSLRDRMDAALANLPDDTDVEDALSASWQQQDGQWAAVAVAGLEKEDACPTLFGRVDMSVQITARMQPKPNLTTRNIDLALHLDGNASDWDSFRCWAGSAGIGLALLGIVVPPFITFPAAIGSLILVGEIVRGDVGSQVGSQDVGSDFAPVGSGTSWAEYAGTAPLPSLPFPGGIPSDAVVGPDGLLTWGDSLTILPATHQVVWLPLSETLPGGWYGRVNCRESRWDQTYECEPVRVTDVPLVVGTPLPFVPVTMFGTSTVVPSSGWFVDMMKTPEIKQYVTLTGDTSTAGTSAMAIIHSSAGIRRYRIDVPAAVPSEPDDLPLRLFNCRQWGRDIWDLRVRIGWLVDPPPFAWDQPLLREWQLTFEEVPAGTSLSLRPIGTEQDLVAFESPTAGSVSLEVVTHGQVELELVSNLPEAPSGARLMQRWLLPTGTAPVESSVVGLVRAGGLVAATEDTGRVTVFRAAEQLEHAGSFEGVSAVRRDRGAVVVDSSNGVFRIDGSGVTHGAVDVPAEAGAGRRPANRMRVAMRDGSVAAALGSHVVLARPFSIR